MTGGQSIDYDGLTQQALRSVVRTVLTAVAKTGLPGEHHFFIAFDTRATGVSMSRRLKEKYPEEMMIVLQHRFWDLSVTEDRFEVKLTFDGIPERLVVPFTAIKVFFDPSVRYTLQFEEATAVEDAPDTADRRRPRDVAEVDTQPTRLSEHRRPHAIETAEEPAAPAPLPASARKSEEKPGEPAPAAEVDSPAPAAAPEPSPTGVVQPAPSPAGAKVVSIDSWRNRK